MLSLFDKFVGSHLNVLVEQVASKYLLSVFKVELIGSEEHQTESHLSSELQVLIVEKDVVIVKEQELKKYQLA